MSDANDNPSNDSQDVKNESTPAPSNDAPKEPNQQKTVPLAALHEAREENKKLKERLDSIEADTKAKAEEKAKEQGKFEELFNATKAELESSKATIEQLTAKVTEYDTAIETNINKSLEAITNEADKTLITSLIEGKSPSEKQALLPSLIDKFGQPKDVNASIVGDKKTGVNKDTVKSVSEQLTKAQADKAPISTILRLEKKLNELKR